jgi:hypothetical protein
MSKPTHEDGLMLLKIKSWGHSIGFLEARRFVWSDEFPLELAEYEQKIQGKPEEELVEVYIEVLETVGGLFKHGLLHPDLIFDIDYFSGIWNRFERLFLEVRERDKFPSFMGCFEAMVKAEQEYHKE